MINALMLRNELQPPSSCGRLNANHAHILSISAAPCDFMQITGLHLHSGHISLSATLLSFALKHLFISEIPTTSLYIPFYIACQAVTVKRLLRHCTKSIDPRLTTNIISTIIFFCFSLRPEKENPVSTSPILMRSASRRSHSLNNCPSS